MGFGRSNSLAMEMLSVPGDAEPCPETGYRAELLSGWRPGVSCRALRPSHSFPTCQ